RIQASIVRVRRPRWVELILILALMPGAALAQVVGSVRGVVRDSLGGVVSDAHVAIRGSSSRTISGRAGEFRLAGLPPGDALLEVRRLGYRPASSPVTIAAGRELEVDVALSPVPEQLAPVEVQGTAQVYDSRLAGFNARKSKKVGHIVTREKLDQMHSARFVDALRGMPGVSVRTLRGGVVTVSLRGARCAPVFYMDGFPATSGTMDLDMIDLSGVEGIEVYSGMASIPAEFMISTGGESCGVIAVWSRPFRPRPRPRESVPLAELERLIAAQRVFTADQVTAPALLISGEAGPPVYPDSLLAAGIPGKVVAEFIVGEDGRIEPGTLTIASATHEYFSSAVRAALDGALFVPGVLDDKPVRQLVQLPFYFDPARAGHDSAAISR
ncbi:MAG TPA: carboxypeptidase regulatory-like domain-containing protein, partial [Gemmatimonadaceae bacterium]|nr:carboxypeptidase regulatory-like domain-containing protein [Gemmatimonadaceae bacterium]